VLGDDGVHFQEVHFVHPARGPTAAYDAFFGAPVRFSSDCEALLFSRSLLEAPLLTASPELAQLLVERGPARARAGDAVVDRVREAIAKALAADDVSVDLADIAASLDTPARSLQRTLAGRNTSYSALLDEARRNLAKALLAREGTPLAQVAYRLGFRDASTFFRAFRKWTGTSPRAFQKAPRT
jgi:AraC-like DNA-binding protein